MKTSDLEIPKETLNKGDPQKLSKKNLLQLLQGRKIKAAKTYIAQLKNSNPRAEKIIKQVLQEIFCQRKVNTATTYMYALVFYKNLLINGQVDYYEDNEFFPQKIHEAVSQICEYNEKQQNISEKGRDYFFYCIKIQKNSNNNEDMQATGSAVIVFAMELLQSMAEWYPENYFTEDESHFSKKYKYCLSKGIKFPPKQSYVYIKEQDKKQFQHNYSLLFENQEQEKNKDNAIKKQQKQEEKIQQPTNNLRTTSNQGQYKDTQKPPNTSGSIKPPNKIEQELKPQSNVKNKVTIQKSDLNTVRIANDSSPQINPRSSIEKQLIPNQIKQKKSTITSPERNLQQTKKLNLNEPKIQSTETTIKKQMKTSVGVQQILNRVQDKRKINQNEIINQSKEKHQQKNHSPSTSRIQNKSTQNLIIELKNSRNKSSDIKVGNQIQSIKNTSSIKPEIAVKTMTQNKLQAINISKVKKVQIQNFNEHIKSKVQPEIRILPQTKSPNDSKQISFLQKKSFKRTEEASHRTPQKSLLRGLKSEQSQQYQSNFGKSNQKGNIKRHNHRIFEPVNKQNILSQKRPLAQRLSPQKKVQLSTNQPLTSMNENILHQNVSFSAKLMIPALNNPALNISARQQSQKRQKKSVPKTQKKQSDKSFFENEQFAFKLNATQNMFTANKGKKSYEKFPMKTLSAWRCQKQVKKDYSPEYNAKQQIMGSILRNLQLKQKALPFVPEYFSPLTLKMSGLRRSALQIWSFTESSQVFFNNNIIEARLMKPSRNSYILSILNVSRLSLRISLGDIKNIKYADQIQIIGNSISADYKTTLNTGCYMDIKFTFQTADLNFKFLPLSLLIDSRTLSLQLPITLLDQCIIQKDIQINQISLYSKKSSRIIKSQPIKINRNDLPRFIRNSRAFQKEQKSIVKNNSPFEGFTLKMKLQDEEYWSVLNCWLSQVNGSMDMHQISVLFDLRFEETENLAKVITQLLAFLLYE